MSELSKAPLKRIMKKYGQIISQDALNLFQTEVEKYANTLAKQSANASKLRNRKTVLAKDVQFILDM